MVMSINDGVDLSAVRYTAPSVRSGSSFEAIDPREVYLKDGAQLDAFGRLRTSEPHGVFESKQISQNDPYMFEELLVGTATATFQYDRSSTYLAVDTASGDRAVRQTTRYLPYVPGKSQQVVCTGIMGAGKTNVNQYIGYFDDLNGLYFKLQGTTFGVGVRSSVTGSPVDTFIQQSEWNIDRMNPLYGLNPSGVTLDITKAQIFVIDFQWLGAGRVRFSLDIGGKFIPVHELLNANNSSAVYMSTPTLPVRYEVVNTGASASATTLEQICCAVSSEGGYPVPGMEHTVANGVTRVAVTTRAPVLLVRLKTAFPAGEPNRRTIKILDFGATATGNDAFIELMHLHTPTVTATWADVDDSSGAEYSVSITSLTAAHSHRVKTDTAITGLAGVGGSVVDSTEFVNAHSFVSQNYDSTNSEIFAVYATSESGTANISAHITFIESE